MNYSMMAGSYQMTHNKPIGVANPPNSFEYLQSKQVLPQIENDNTPQNLSMCNPHEINKTIPMRPLPSIEGIITNTVAQVSYEQGRSNDNELYNFINRNNASMNAKNNVMDNSQIDFEKNSIPSNQNSINHNWDKSKLVQEQPSVSNTSYGLVSHVLEQHFGFKEEHEFLDALETLPQKDDGSSELPLCTSREPQVILAENKDPLPDQDIDSDSTSSTESSSAINIHDVDSDNEEEKSRLFECNECEMYVRSKGNLKVHMRLHTGVHPYMCKECGESFPSCNLFHKHQTQHGASIEKTYSCNECGKSFMCEKHFKSHRRKHVVPKMFDCSECKQSFATRDRLIRHSRIHFGEITYFCDKCGKFFANKLRFDEHKLTHGHSSWKCEDCDSVTYENPQQLEKHIVTTHEVPKTSDDVMQPIQLAITEDNKRFACEICSLKFEKISEYYIHRCNHKSPKTYKCDICSASFYKEFHLHVHTSAHKIPSFECDVCETSFKTKKALRYHMQKNNHKLPFMCSHCDFSFKEEPQLLSHMKTHCGDKPYSCDQCQATFRHSSTLKMHQRIHTDDTPFVCSVCKASFIQSQHLQIHLRSHSGNKPYKCNECNASFTKKDYLFAHRTKHGNEGANLIAGGIVTDNNLGTGISSLRCTYCEMTFSHQSTLAAHLRKHTGERPFVCDKCGASFLYSSNLTTHRRKHTGERPYKCKECDASFTLKSYLTMHLRKHSGERPFKCDICESSFTQKTHLSTHRRIHTGEYPYKCDICGDAFRDGANFWRHKKKHLDDTQNSNSANGGTSEAKFSRPKVKRLRTKNSSGSSKVVPSTPSFIPHQFLDEGNRLNGGTYLEKNDDSYNALNAAVKAETIG